MKFAPCYPSYQQKVLPALKYLVVAVVSLMVMPPSQADVAQKNIGDLEIYKSAEGGKVTITMMLDTSGSMGLTQSGVGYEACDLPSGVNYSSYTYENSTTTPSYKRYYCTGTVQRSTTVTTYYYKNVNGTWYSCGTNGSTDQAKCTTKINKPSSTTLNKYQTDDSIYYYKTSTSTGAVSTDVKYYDRITRLKDAIFALMDSSALDSNKVSIGIGQFSTQSDSNNKQFSSYGDSISGKILVPAALITDAQKATIKNAIAGLIAEGGTPSANAYAEAGAYMLGTNTTNFDYSNYSGYKNSITRSKSGSNYISPLAGNVGQCNGQGIYFLTDGVPNGSSNNIAKTLMSTSFNGGNITFDSGLVSVDTSQDRASSKAWEYIAGYSKALRNTTNPILQQIRTATVGFGNMYNIEGGLPKKTVMIGTMETTVTDCDKLKTTNKDTQDSVNLCKWGEKSYGYGEGGFYSAQSTDDVINSIVNFVSDLNQTIPAAPSGTITVPDDPYRADSQLAVAYYPMVEAKVSEAKVIWPGNVKKYNLKEGTLFGKSDQALFTNVSGDLNPSTQDLWSNADYSNANNAVTSGGFYAQLNTPNAGVSSLRTLYIEDLTASGATTTKLRKLAVNTSGKITLDGNVITDSNTFNDKTTYSVDNVVKLLKFLGFDNISVADTGTDVARLSGITLTTANATTAIKVVGATIHSSPTAVSYSATLDDDGRVTDSRDDYVLFGSMDGALHLVNADNYGNSNGGKEVFAIIPRTMMNNQADALVKDAQQGNIGAPKAGIDAPWLVTADYKYDFTNKKVNIDMSGSGATQKGVFAYGGLRMGGDGIHGLNLSNYNTPTMLFSIDSNTAGFERIGQIWAKPTKAKIKTSATDTGTDVLIFGGGYDTCYEDENYQVGTTTSALRNQRGSLCNRTTSAEALGNAVYIVNAKTGALIWSATKSANSIGTNTTNPYLNNSIVAGITVLDRNNDGFMDGIYFADLGGQLFRADFTNAGDRIYAKNASGNYVATQQASFANRRVTRMLQPQYAIANAAGVITTNTNAKYNLRFYERPVVSFFRDDNSKLFAMVNVISGDRSSPLSKIRAASNADRLYGIIDSDVTKANSVFFANDFTTTNTNKQSVADIADADLVNIPTSLDADLVNIPTSLTASVTLATKTSTISAVKGKKGWYYPLTRFDGYANVLYNKGVGKSEVINSMLYTTVYNPDMSYGANNPCSAQIVGGSERQLYCLPYGVCMDSASTTGTGGFLRAGQGIQELTLGPYSSSKTNIRLLIGNTNLTQRADTQTRFNYGADNKKEASLLKTNQNLGGNLAITQTGGDGSAAEYLYRERYTLNPKTWYEVFN